MKVLVHTCGTLDLDGSMCMSGR